MKTSAIAAAALLTLGMNACPAADDAGAKDASKELAVPSATDGKGRRCFMHDGMMGGPGMMMGHAMMGGPGMMGGPMMGGHMGQMIMLPRLPAGNEKLELAMHAEMLQKIGEIEAKYAAQLK